MGFIDDFLDCMPHTVTHAEKSGSDDYGVPNFGSEVSFSARVIYKPTKVRTPDGRETLARGVVWIGGTPTIEPGDNLTLPDGTIPTILASDIMADEDGESHTKVYFG